MGASPFFDQFDPYSIETPGGPGKRRLKMNLHFPMETP